MSLGNKYCEGCGMGFLRQIPETAKSGEKYCVHCKPIFGSPNPSLPHYSNLIDPHHPTETYASEVNREFGADMIRRQRLQLAWTQSFARELSTLEAKQREMKIRQGGRYAKHG